MDNKYIELLQERMGDILKKGGDYADVFIQAGAGHSAHYEDGRIEELSSSNADGCGVRIIVGDKTYFSHSPGASASSIDNALSSVCDSALGIACQSHTGSGDALLNLSEKAQVPEIDFFKELNQQIRKESAYVRQVAFRYSTQVRRILIVKCDGSSVFDTRNYTNFTAQVITEKDGVLQTVSERGCMASSYHDFKNSCKPFEIAHSALNRALLMLSARPCPAGRMNVLLDGEAGGTIIHEACGHGLEADIVDKDYSVYRDKIGELVADESVTMIDDPTIPGLYGSYEFDDEGTKSSKNILIENGVLKKYLTDILSAKTLGLPVTGNGRRQSCRSIPLPRMSNTYLASGSADFNEMLSRAKNGLYVKKMGGGEVNPTSGDFVFYVSEAYIIKKGKICEPVRGATLTGNGPDALKNIMALGNNLIMDPGVCGKSGQGVPVTDGQPSMLIRGLTVGGSEA